MAGERVGERVGEREKERESTMYAQAAARLTSPKSIKSAKGVASQQQLNDDEPALI